MNDQAFEDFLKRTLQQSSEYIDDGDFSASVMASLPKPNRLNPWLERLIIILPVTLIALLVASQLPWRDFVRPVYGWLLTFDTASLVAVAVGVILLVAAAPLLWMLRKTALI